MAKKCNFCNRNKYVVEIISWYLMFFWYYLNSGISVPYYYSRFRRKLFSSSLTGWSCFGKAGCTFSWPRFDGAFRSRSKRQLSSWRKRVNECRRITIVEVSDFLMSCRNNFSLLTLQVIMMTTKDIRMKKRWANTSVR